MLSRSVLFSAEERKDDIDHADGLNAARAEPAVDLNQTAVQPTEEKPNVSDP